MFFVRLLVKLIAPFVRVRHSDEGCEYEFDTNTIYYDPTQNPQDVGFLRHIAEKHNFPNPEQFSIHLWSVLHELGHHFNPDETDEWAKVVCAIVDYEDAIKSKAVQDLYYDSPDEFAATEWACAWIENHPKLATLFSKLLG